MPAEKSERAEQLRSMLLRDSPEAIETDRAKISLSSLSFQSSSHPARHLWIETEGSRPDGSILIDLEDWGDEAEWDNAVARVKVATLDDAVGIARRWLTGHEAALFARLGKNYRQINREEINWPPVST